MMDNGAPPPLVGMSSLPGLSSLNQAAPSSSSTSLSGDLFSEPSFNSSVMQVKHSKIAQAQRRKLNLNLIFSLQ